MVKLTRKLGTDRCSESAKSSAFDVVAKKSSVKKNIAKFAGKEERREREKKLE